MKTIANKQEYYTLARKLQLGNVLTQWTPYEFADLLSNLFEADPTTGIVGVRHTDSSFKGAKSFRTTTRKALDCLYDHFNETCLDWLDKDDLNSIPLLFDEAVNDDHMIFQGELMADYQGLYVRGSTKQCHQRDLWESGEYQHYRGLRASAILQKYMDNDSWEEANRILQEYAYPVIEFACFDRPIGRLGTNTIFWEVRTNY